MPSPSIEDFIRKWKRSAAAETANFQSFLLELCDILDVPRPDPATKDPERDAYVFERAVNFTEKGTRTGGGFIDLYHRGHFIMEAKQGSGGHDEVQTEFTSQQIGTARRETQGWDTAMDKAYQQARAYARAMALAETPAPFLILVDVGYCIDIFADFSQTSIDYHHFPSIRNSRILLDDLHDPEVRERLRTLWLDPWSLDPGRRAARVTREVAEKLAKLAQELEAAGHEPAQVASFLMRCLFTMFAEDVGLLPTDCFTELLIECRREGTDVSRLVAQLWRDMDTGGQDNFSVLLRKRIRRFNGGLFASHDVLPLSPAHLDLLIEAARADWTHVEPAIFGTLLERALHPDERHRLGAHYTPRAYVERLVMPTVILPLRNEWESVRVEAQSLHASGKTRDAVQTLQDFHRRLCDIRILDPACGSGNFLYIAMEHLKRLEAEVLDLLQRLDAQQAALEMEGFAVNPAQFLGLELNPRASAIAELVLWLGFLRWQIEHSGLNAIPEPVLQDFHNIETRDAVLAHSGTRPRLDDQGQPLRTWDRRTYRRHPVTGEDVPDERATVEVLDYLEPRRPAWPKADFIVGNPPFIGNWRFREVFGDGYAEALRDLYPEVPESADFVMYWWNRAAHEVRRGRGRRFGFITTNSIHQVFGRRVVAHHLEADPPLRLRFAIPDHPWVDSGDGADVRVAMTVADLQDGPGLLQTIAHEERTADGYRNVQFAEKEGELRSNLRIGADITKVVPLQANDGICSPGVKLHGAGFKVTPERAAELGLGRIPGLDRHIRWYRNGRDINQQSRGLMVIDLDGLTANQVRDSFPDVYQHVHDHVKPERDVNKEAYRRENWWLFGRKNTLLRGFLRGLPRYIATVETSKHRFFVFLDASILPDNMLVNVGSDDAFVLGVLSSSYHVTWALAAGGRLGIGNDPRYNKTRCFDPFPFPACDEAAKERIRAVAERLDAHRKSRQELHPELKLTELYNVLEALREGRDLSDKERKLHEKGAVGILLELHNELDEAVRLAYGWPKDMSEDEILEALVDLNLERAMEESRGMVRWLRPDFQAPEASTEQLDADLDTTPAAPAVQPRTKQEWPKDRVAQVDAIHTLLRESPFPLDIPGIASHFRRAPRKRIREILTASRTLGYVEVTDDTWGWR